MTDSPMKQLFQAVRQHGLVRFVEHFKALFPNCHLKDLVVDEVDAHRGMVVDGQRVVNFGSDSFLGLDQDPRVQESVINGVKRWGTHNGASRAFSCVRANAEAEAVRLVSTAAESYFKERAEIMRRLDVLNNTLAHNTKYVVPSGSSLINVLGLDGVTKPVESVAGLKSAGGPMAGNK